jgi:uncharacterized membrane protein
MVGPAIASTLSHLGAIICSQDRRRLLTIGSSSTWLCARCTGIYSAYCFVSIWDLIRGRSRSISLGGLALSVLLLGVCSADALFFHRSDGIQDELIRYFSGFSAGVGLAICINSVWFVTEPPSYAPLSAKGLDPFALIPVGLVALYLGITHILAVLDAATLGGFIFLGLLLNAGFVRVLGAVKFTQDRSLSLRAGAVTAALFAAEIAVVRTFK